MADKKYRKDGFTLVETLVVIAIMAVLSTMLLAYNHSNTTQIALTTDQAAVAGALNRAKALALEKYTGAGAACAYGVHFGSANTYLIYGYPASPSSDCTAPFPYVQGSSLEIQNFQLDAGVAFNNSVPLDIYFVPPYLRSNGGTINLRVAETNPVQVSVSTEGAVSLQ